MESTVETVIEQIIEAAFAEKSAREKHLFRASLHNLVRLARTEQIMEIKSSVRALTGAVAVNAHGRKARVNPVLHDMETAGLRQQQFEFAQNDEKGADFSPARAKSRGVTK